MYAVAIAASQTARQQAYKFLAHYSQVRLSVNGEDIAALGVPRGPLYGRILRMVHNEKLDRGIVSRQQELHSLRAIVSRLQAPVGKNSKITYRQQKPKVLK